MVQGWTYMNQVNKSRNMKGLIKAILFCFLFSGVSGCIPSGPTPPPSITDSTIPSPREILNSVGTRPAALKLDPMVALEPQVASQTEFPYEGKLFSLSVRDTSLEDVLLALAQEAALNLVIDRQVQRDELISVEFANIPLQSALDNLMSVYDYHYTIKKGVIHVQAFEERIFKVNYPLVYSQSDSETGGDVLGSGGSGGGSGSDTAKAAEGTAVKGEFTVKTTVKDEEYLDVWGQIEEALKKAQGEERGLLSEDGVAKINRMGSTILVKDHPSNIKSVAAFLQSIKETLRRQVIIEAKIVEVVLDKSHQYGVNWEHVRFNFAKSGGKLETSMNLGELGTNGFSLHFSEFVGMDQGEAFLHALASNGEVNMLSSPRLNVINNQSAFINVGRIVPFLDFQIGESTSGGTGGLTERTTIDSVPVIARFNEGVSLGITPQIDEDGVTILHIVPIVTEQTGTQSIEVPSTVIGGDSTIADIPIISVRESDTFVRVEDGNTIVIGGLISEVTGDTVKKVPLLGDIPILNWAFTHQDRKNRKSELVILLTTTVVMR